MATDSGSRSPLLVSCIRGLGKEWLDSCAFAPNGEGILTSANGRFGLGAVLIVECRRTGRFLIARKSFRPGYEMNHRFTFPGGMVRAADASDRISYWIDASLRNRVLVEVGLDLGELESIFGFDLFPSVVATYTARGRAVSTAIIAFHGSSSTLAETRPLWLVTIVSAPDAGHFVQQDAAELVTTTMKWWLLAR